MFQNEWFFVYLPDDGNGKAYDYMLVNPKIMSHSVQRAYLPTGEGCLSVDENIPGLVHRHFRVTIKALDIDGNEVKLRLKGYPKNYIPTWDWSFKWCYVLWLYRSR